MRQVHPERERTDGELVRAILAGRSTAGHAWHTLLGRHRALLASILRGFERRTGGALLWDVDDLCQELYLHLSSGEWYRLRCYRPRDGVRFASWLAAVAYNLIRQRHHTPEPAAVSLHEPRGEYVIEQTPAARATPEEALIRRETAAAIQQAIARLRHRDCQEIIRRHWYHGERLCDIAADLRSKAPAIRRTYKRNRDELRGLLAQELL